MSDKGILYRYLPTEQAPPKEVWQRLEKVLDNNERSPFIQLGQLAVSPPAMAWDNIANFLDENINNAQPSFGAMMYAAEKEPPPAAWTIIEKELIKGSGKDTKKAAPRIMRMVTIGLAAAACIGGVIFAGLDYFDGQPPNAKTSTIAVSDKKEKSVSLSHDSNTKSQSSVASTNTGYNSHDKTSNPFIGSIWKDTNPTDNPETDEQKERDTQLEKRKWDVAINDINTTNNNVASKKGKLKNLDGKIIDRISDYNTGGVDYLAAIGPNGNSVRVSTKLANMIEFFQEDSVKNANEEYLDKVMRNSNVWRKKLIDWKAKVDKADADPSQMNFLDPIDLLKFLSENE